MNKSSGNGIQVLLLITCSILSSNVSSHNHIDKEVYDRATGKYYEVEYAGDGRQVLDLAPPMNVFPLTLTRLQTVVYSI